MAVSRRLLLLSNGTPPGGTLFEHAWEALDTVLAGARRIAFVPYARAIHDEYTAVIRQALTPLGAEVNGVHEGDPLDALARADAVFVGGGNSFRLLRALQVTGLLAAIRERASAGMPYIGSSAGTNMACPTLRTTNDMPIVQPPSFDALGLVPFQVNPHYPATQPVPNVGETRDQRLLEFLEENDVPVIALCEGSWVEVVDDAARVGGVAPGRLFVRGSEPRDLPPGSDVSHLLATRPRFDIA